MNHKCGITLGRQVLGDRVLGCDVLIDEPTQMLPIGVREMLSFLRRGVGLSTANFPGALRDVSEKTTLPASLEGDSPLRLS
jgi:hypothetical protein